MPFLFGYLLDTNIFLRLAEKNSRERPVILNAIRKIRGQNKTICYTPQILAEFWNVCTRPATARGGFGLSITQTERKLNLIQKHFELLPDNLSTFTEWRTRRLRAAQQSNRREGAGNDFLIALSLLFDGLGGGFRRAHLNR